MISGTKTPVNILLVEDEPSHFQLIKRRFEGYDSNMVIFPAHSLLEARKIIRKVHPDVAIVDYNMPDGNGIDLIKNRRKNDYPIVMMTSHGDEELAVEAIKSGAFDYVVKSPESMHNLPRLAERTIREWNNINLRKKTDEKLKKQYEQLKKINNELDRFVYSASHDLRAPLLSVLGLINISRMAALDDEQIKHLDLMEGSIKRLDRYISDIANYSKNNRLDIEVTKVNLKKIIYECIDDHKFVNSFGDLRIEVVTDEDCDLYTDEVRLKIILNNLISNALKYHNVKKLDPFVNIIAYVSEKGCKISITDNGRGIGKEHLDKIFNMFYRGSEYSEGSGLGLYIAKEAVAKLNGEISVRSVENIETEFTVTIPNKIS